MNENKFKKQLAKYHQTLEPDYRRHCAQGGVSRTPPPVLWSSFHGSGGSLVMTARILWDGQTPDVSDPFTLCDPSNPENIIGAPESIARLAADRVIEVFNATR